MTGASELGISVGIIGCGLIGKKRAAALGGTPLEIVCDVSMERAQALAAAHGARATTDPDAVWQSSAQVVIVATPNHLLAPMAAAALTAGKHVLIEKPGAISCAELDSLIALSATQDRRVRIGYNHRFHPALLAARALVDSDVLGPLMMLRARYGHGGRIGYEREWRADRSLSGGGELMDQGVHLIDLARWFLGEFPTVEGHVHTSFWDMPVEDNAFLSLRTAAGQTAWLHCSCSEWKNLFSFELYGRVGKLQIDGLGGSYGVERLTHYRMLPEMGPPETTIWEYPRGDQSWELEFQEFLRDIELAREPECGLRAGLAVMRVVERIYQSAHPRS